MFTGPKIVTDNLILNLDAGSDKSSPGSGTVWKDLAKNNNVDLINGAVFRTGSEGGSVFFDGSNDHATGSIQGLSSETTITVETFYNWNDEGINGRMFFGFTSYDVWTQSGNLGYNNGASNIIGITADEVNSLGIRGSFHHYTFVMRNSSSNLTDNKLYIDGNLKSISAVLNNDGACKNFTDNFQINSWNNNDGYFNKANIAYFRIYNRELSQEEVTQNYNATKQRFNL